MGSDTSDIPKTWIKTPCLRSAALSRAAGCNIYLKLENLQPSGSFKSRGVGNSLASAIRRDGPSKPIHFYCSSGGNAGLACVDAANTLKRPATIVVPTTTSALMVQKLKLLGADVVQIGNHWSEADTYLREQLLENDENGVYIHPFDHPDIWTGHSSIIDELEAQLEQVGSYDAIVCSVGGGGLLAGIMQGLERKGRLSAANTSSSSKSVKVLAVETTGAESLNASISKGELVTLPGITSIAKSLGATQVAPICFEWAQRPEVVSCVLSDAKAAMACVQFADDERIIVESACGVSVATAYDGSLRSALFKDLSDAEFASKNVVIVVCGGSNITLQILEEYQKQYGDDKDVVSKFPKRSVKDQVANGDGHDGSQKVPFVMHDEQEHMEQERPECDDTTAIPPKPAIAIMQSDEVEKQLETFGRVVNVKT